MISIDSFSVEPRSKFDIEAITLQYLQRYLPACLERPRVLDVERLIDVSLSDSHHFMQMCVSDLDEGVEAEVDIIEKKIRFSEAGWEGVIGGNPRSLFTGAHESFHVIDHAQQVLNALLNGDFQVRAARGSRPTYCDAEWQANHGAGAFLMPKTTFVPFVASLKERQALPFDITWEVQRAYGVSRQAAETRLVKLGLN